MNEQNSYYAFISYKREDKKEAKRLQHALEYYRLPNHLRQENSELPEYVRPIFRDMTDLEVGELSAQIHSALEQSHYLIVICSPLAATSKWVNDEVEYFISLGKQDKIIPYIIDGVPHANNTDEECYPPALLRLSKEKELLGANINEVGKDSATIRVVSRMFNIRFDTLYQRYEREQKRKKWMWIGCSILIALLGLSIGGYFVRQNGIIERQNKILQQDSIIKANNLYKISAQNDSIASQNNLILSQRDSIEYSIQQLQLSNRLLAKERDNVLKANWSLKLSNAKIISQNILSQLRTGNLLAAREVASHICSDDRAKDLVQISEVELSLRKVYRELNREGLKQMYMLDHLGEISYVKFDKQGSRFYIISNDSLITEYDTFKGTLNVVYKVRLDIDVNRGDIQFYEFDKTNGNVYYSIDSTAFVQNIYSDSDNGVSIQFAEDISDMIVSPSFDCMVCELMYENGDHYNYEWHLIKVSDKTSDDFIIPQCENIYCFSPDGQKVFAYIDDKYCIYNLNTKSIEKRVSYDYCILEAHFSCDGRNIYIMGQDNHNHNCTIDVFNTTLDTFVEFVEKIDGSGLTISDFLEKPQQNRIIVGDYDGNLKVYNIEKNKMRTSVNLIETLSAHSERIESIVFNATGTKMLSVSNGKVCVWIDDVEKYSSRFRYIGNSGKAYIEIRNGLAQLYDVSSDRAIGSPLFEQDGYIWIKHISRNSEVVIVTKDSLLYVIWPNKNNFFTIPFVGPRYALEFSIDREGKKLAMWDVIHHSMDHSLQIYDLNKNTLLAHNKSIYCVDIALDSKGEEIAISTGDNIFIANANTLVPKLYLPKMHTGYIVSLCYSPDGKYIISASWDRTVCMWNAQSGSLIKTFRGAEQELRSCSMSSDGNYILATTNRHNKRTAYIWSVQTGEIVEQLQCEDNLTFCQDVPNKIVSDRGGDNYFLDFPSVDELISFFKK